MNSNTGTTSPAPQTNLASCTLCPRECVADRYSGEGYCKGPAAMKINLHRLHFWEEPVISGTRGSGTVFFSHCTMRCVYCQNYPISQTGHGTLRTPEDLCAMALDLQDRGAHNVNLVTASHYTPQVAESLALAKNRGLAIPVVWNSNAYEKPETLKMLEGLVDIYLPDFRYADPSLAKKYSDASDYPQWAKGAILEMHRQAGNLVTENGIAVKGLIVRLLVLPGNVNEIGEILKWIAAGLGTDTCISLMGQYYPVYRSEEFPEINRSVTEDEYSRCLELLERHGFENGFIQEVGSTADYTPEFSGP